MKTVNSVLASLHTSRVSLIDWAALPKVFSGPLGAGGGRDVPETAIEDFGSDYRNDGVEAAAAETVDGDDGLVDF